MRACAIVPAYNAGRSVAQVVRDLRGACGPSIPIWVVDDGSTDDTVSAAEEAGARLVSHAKNRGKGAALRTGFTAGYQHGFDVAITVDADGQHPANEAARLLSLPAPADALVLGIRDLVRAGAPRPNQISNQISNFFLSFFARSAFRDTQCGLRRYPLASTLTNDGGANGYSFEAEIILRLFAAGVAVVEEPIDVIYPPANERVSHFDSVRDPARIVGRVVKTLVETAYISRPARQRKLPGRSAVAMPSTEPQARLDFGSPS